MVFTGERLSVTWESTSFFRPRVCLTICQILSAALTQELSRHREFYTRELPASRQGLPRDHGAFNCFY